MTRRRPPQTPALDQLSGAERGQLLTELLTVRPELAEAAEGLAWARMASADSEAVADAVERDLRHADSDQLAVRVGRAPGRGYVHETEAAREILEEALAPYLDDIRRRAALQLEAATTLVGFGVLCGLAACRTHVDEGTVLAYAGEDVIDELAYSVFAALSGAPGLLLEEQVIDLPPEWERIRRLH